jgi:hypothetical protein
LVSPAFHASLTCSRCRFCPRRRTIGPRTR